MFEFPFNVEIWGTVSDWFMVIVTSLTGLLLYFTLRSQINLTRIERYKYKLFIKPQFKADAQLISFSKDKLQKQVSFWIYFELVGHRCKVESIMVYQDEEAKDLKAIPLTYVEVGWETAKLINLLSSHNYPNFPFMSSAFIEIIMVDVEGQKYSQKIEISIHGEEINIYCKPSQEIE